MASRASALARMVSVPVRGSGVIPGRPLASRARWSRAQALQWSADTPWLFGANFTPSTASNQMEFWQDSTYDPETIDRELGWAANTLGMNSVRVFLHDLLWITYG
ncbi:MAG: hypothetical protein ACR2OH_04880, partial [Microthrixaceae bacterium]